jgi:radical SAM protein (TIGR01212 family)
MYKTLNEHYKQKFGCKVYKLSLDGGFTCPNRDGTKSFGGCIFCSASGSGDFAKSGTDILKQLEEAKALVESKNKSGKYIAYFQAFTNTYAPPEILREKYLTAISPDYIVGIAIATRPDCLPDEVIEVLKEINLIKPVSVELGLQTINEKTAEFINRNYANEDYFDAVKRLKEAGIEVVTHIIIGLPNETKTDAVNTTKAAVRAGSDGVKFHLLHVLKGTKLETVYKNNEFSALSLEEYAEILKACILELPSETVVHRITGDGAKRDLIAPLWSANKKAVLNYLKKYLN